MILFADDEGFFVKDVTSGFLFACSDKIFNCVFKYNLESSRESQLALLVLFKNTNHTLLTSLRTRNKRESGDEDKSTRYEEDQDVCSVKPLQIMLTDIVEISVVAPLIYSANTCSGSCNWHPNMSYDMSFVENAIFKQFQKIINQTLTRDGRFHICCAPTKYRPLSILYIDHKGYIHFKQLPKMGVTACGCL